MPARLSRDMQDTEYIEMVPLVPGVSDGLALRACRFALGYLLINKHGGTRFCKSMAGLKSIFLELEQKLSFPCLL